MRREGQEVAVPPAAGWGGHPFVVPLGELDLSDVGMRSLITNGLFLFLFRAGQLGDGEWKGARGRRRRRVWRKWLRGQDSEKNGKQAGLAISFANQT